MNNTYYDPSDIFDRKNDRTFLFLIVLTVLVWGMPLLVVPEVIHNDSVEYIRLAKYILTDTDGPNALYPLLTVTLHVFVGDYEFAGILVPVIFSTVIVTPVYHLGKKLFDAPAGLVGAGIPFKYSTMNYTVWSITATPF